MMGKDGEENYVKKIKGEIYSRKCGYQMVV